VAEHPGPGHGKAGGNEVRETSHWKVEKRNEKDINRLLGPKAIDRALGELGLGGVVVVE